MIQLMVSLLSPQGRVQEIQRALRAVMLPARQERGCNFAQIYRRVDDERRLHYVEEWADADQLRAQFGSERFIRLLELLETAPERPIVEFRLITETHGLEYITSGQVVPDRTH